MTYSNRIPINLQSVIDAADNGFVVIDKDYRIIAANHAYCHAYGISSKTIIGRKCHQVSHHSEIPCHLNGEDCPHKKVFETREPHQVLHIHYDANKEEEHVRIKGSPIYGTDGELFLGEAVFPIAKSNDFGCDKQRMIGKSPSFLACIEEMSGAASSDIPILLNGESGVGKELAANFIHNKSRRCAQPFISIDCASITDGIFESELFGHERGAFTGCIGCRHGLIDTAAGGTLFLDEIGELPLALQGRLLRVLDTGNYRRLGGREDLHVDVRIICATHNNLRKMVEQGLFRADLYYRIAGISITIPPLRERRSDIVPLVNAMLKKIKAHNGSAGRISEEAMLLLQNYDYPGNIRELHNILHKAVTISTGGLITPDLLQLNNFSSVFNNPLADSPLSDRHVVSREHKSHDIKSHAPSTNQSLTDVEATHIESLLHQHDGHRARVAEELRISERTLYRKLKQYNLQGVGKSH
ncbi:sigma 54-interacting transcriptional regulator [Cardiobacterium sp. AH-315-I02]|nr:sigma 54-interacting transcriptional regulator [Cardiobacterium sp. AH-315-I02]